MEIYERKSIQWYICKSPNFEDRGGECFPPLIIYIKKGEGKEGCLGEKDISIYDCIDFADISFPS